MNSARSQSPIAYSPTSGTARTRPPLPHGPRSPKPLQKKSTIPLDMCTRIEEASPAYSSQRSSTAWSPSSPGPSEYSSSIRSTTDKAVQTFLGEAASTVASSSPSPAVKVIPKAPTLSPPPPLNFEPVPVPWRGMTFEAAQWSLTSAELQEIVSTAIRSSAQESFIRLVSLRTFNDELVTELQRLDSLKATTQAQYRFNMQRRMMLLQSLNALSFTRHTDGSDGEALALLTRQLADITASCDRLTETLLTILDQRAQIKCIQDVHIASALSVGLRKLNASYGRRVVELKEARAKIVDLQAQLDEAWEVAHELEQEMNDLDNFDLDYHEEEPEEEPAEGQEHVDHRSLIGETYTEHSVQLAQVVEITGMAVATQATYTSLSDGQAQAPERSSRVQAARRRSERTSKASLRLPKSPLVGGASPALSPRLARSRSRTSRRRPSVTTSGNLVHQVPTINIDSVMAKEDSFLDFADTRPASPTTSVPAEAVPPLPQTLTISRRNTLERPPLSPNPALPSPGFDRTIIPPIVLHGTQDDTRYLSRQERQASSRRVQSLQPRSRTDPLPETVASALRRANSDYRKSDWVTGNPAINPKRYSAPLRTATSDTLQAEESLRRLATHQEAGTSC